MEALALHVSPCGIKDRLPMLSLVTERSQTDRSTIGEFKVQRGNPLSTAQMLSQKQTGGSFLFEAKATEDAKAAREPLSLPKRFRFRVTDV